MGGETGTIRVGGAHAYVYFVGFWVRNPTYSTHVPMGSGYESWFVYTQTLESAPAATQRFTAHDSSVLEASNNSMALAWDCEAL